MNELKENVSLDYNMIILRHLDRMSVLTSQMDSLNSDVAKQFGFGDRINILNIAVNFLQTIVPRQLKDSTYKEEIKKLSDEKNMDDYEIANFKLYAIINLLERKGFLFDKGGIAKFKTKQETKEVWE